MGRGRAGLNLADDLVTLIHVDRELVAVRALPVLLGPGSIQVLPSTLGRPPVSGHRPFLALFLVVPAEMLLRCRDQARVNDLTATGDIALAQQLPRDPVKQGLGTRFPNSILEGPDLGPVRNVGRIRQAAKLLVAHPVQQLVLHLLIRQVVQPLQHQNAHHGLCGERWPAAVRTHQSRCHSVHLRRQGRKVNACPDLRQWVSQTVNLVPPVLRRKQVSLDRTSRFHRLKKIFDDKSILSFTPLTGGFSRCPRIGRLPVCCSHRMHQNKTRWRMFG